MKQTVQTWLSQLPGQAGILACAVRFPAQDGLVEYTLEGFREGQLESVRETMMETLHAFTSRQWNARHLCWRFEGHCLELALRADGLAFIALYTLEPSQQKPTLLKSILEEFHNFDVRLAA